MRVVYLGKSDSSLTKGKEYEVIAVENGYYRIIDNTEEDYLYSPKEFEAIED